MQISTFMIAEAGERTSDGLVNIRGGGRCDVFSPTFPARADLTLIMFLDLDPTETGDHRIEINMIDGDAKVLVTVTAKFEVSPGRRTIDALFPLSIDLPAPGLYRFDVKIDDVNQSIMRPLNAYIGQH